MNDIFKKLKGVTITNIKSEKVQGCNILLIITDDNTVFVFDADEIKKGVWLSDNWIIDRLEELGYKVIF